MPELRSTLQPNNSSDSNAIKLTTVFVCYFSPNPSSYGALPESCLK